MNMLVTIPMTPQDDTTNAEPPMHRRETTMPDGRYLYYYTFDDDTSGTPDAIDATSSSTESADDNSEVSDV